MTTVSSSRRVTQLDSLTSLRWYAALGVFLFHLNGTIPFHYRPSVIGFTGVSFFFVLSGFVLTYSAVPGRGVASFYRARFARVYPSHLAVLLVLVVAAAVLPGYEPGGAAAGLAQLVLVQAWVPDLAFISQWNPISWSLSVEAFFYLTFPALLWWARGRGARAQRLAVAALVAAGVAGVVVLVDLGPAGTAAATFFPVVRLAEFATGMLLALELGRTRPVRVPLGLAVAVVGALGVVAWAVVGSVPPPLVSALMLPGYALLILAAATRDASGRRTWLLHHPVSVYLGRVSFAFYLVHFVIIEAVLAAGGWDDTTPGLVPLMLAFAGSLLGAVLLHHAVENPVRRLVLSATWPMRREQA